MKIIMNEQGEIDPPGALRFAVGDRSSSDGERTPPKNPEPWEGVYECKFCGDRFEWRRRLRIDHDCASADE